MSSEKIPSRQIAGQSGEKDGAFAVLAGCPLLPNVGIPLNLDWVRDVRVNTSAVERRAQSHTARRTVKKEWQAFLNEKLAGRKAGNLVTLLCGTLRVGELPLSLRQHEARPIGEIPRMLSYFKAPAA